MCRQGRHLGIDLLSPLGIAPRRRAPVPAAEGAGIIDSKSGDREVFVYLASSREWLHT
jgi:hypothetical protein